VLAAGTLVGRWFVVRPIGRGARGTVYLARATGGEFVALKLLSLPARDDAARFAAEAGGARRLQHPNIVRTVGTGLWRGHGYLAMEPVPGPDLQRYTQPARLLPEAEVARIGAGVAAALAHAHAHGVVHRDVKPANVLVAWKAGAVKLGDFGLANLANLEGGARTRTGLVLGSPAYMAPEQLAGAGASPAGDLWSLGVMLYELLAGRLPFHSASLGELLQQVSRAEAPPLPAARAASPAGAELAAVVHALLAKAPAARGTAAELAARLADAAPPRPATPPT
jgi:serine/threonine-protein kinase